MLNVLCKKDVSGDDCNRCLVHHYIFHCPKNCPDFDDIRKEMPPALLKQRAKYMEALGVKDVLPWEE